MTGSAGTGEALARLGGHEAMANLDPHSEDFAKLAATRNDSDRHTLCGTLLEKQGTLP
jgi:hypothetical protein